MCQEQEENTKYKKLHLVVTTHLESGSLTPLAYSASHKKMTFS